MATGNPKKRDAATRRLQARKRGHTAPKGYVTRRGLRDEAGITEAHLRSLLWRRVIVSDGVNGQGYAVYSLEVLERVKAMKADGSLYRAIGAPHPTAATTGAAPDNDGACYSAQEAVQVFRLLDKGVSVKEIILETQIHPMLVKFIRADYDDIEGAVYLPRSIVEKINALRHLPGSFPLRDGNGILEVLETYATQRACATAGCPRPAHDQCLICLTQTHRLARQRQREAAALEVRADDRESSVATPSLLSPPARAPAP